MARPARRVRFHVASPWDDIQFTEGEIASIKAIASMHRVGYEAILHKVCGVNRISFAMGGADGERETCFAEGKRWAGNQIRNVAEKVQLRPKTRGPEPPTPAPESRESASERPTPEQTAPGDGRSQ